MLSSSRCLYAWSVVFVLLIIHTEAMVPHVWLETLAEKKGRTSPHEADWLHTELFLGVSMCKDTHSCKSTFCHRPLPGKVTRWSIIRDDVCIKLPGGKQFGVLADLTDAAYWKSFVYGQIHAQDQQQTFDQRPRTLTYGNESDLQSFENDITAMLHSIAGQRVKKGGQSYGPLSPNVAVAQGFTDKARRGIIFQPARPSFIKLPGRYYDVDDVPEDVWAKLAGYYSACDPALALVPVYAYENDCSEDPCSSRLVLVRMLPVL